MGQTAAAWIERVQYYLRDGNQVDVSADQATYVGIRPALAQYSIDRPQVVAVDLTPTDRLLALPSSGDGWVEGFSRILSIEAPAGETPPCVLADSEWYLTRAPADPDVMRILLPYELEAGDLARVEFTTTWPVPTATAADDLVSAVAFEAVAALAASMVATSLAAEAGRSRQGSLATNFVDGTERATRLLEVAASLRVLYNTSIGLGASEGVANGAAPRRGLQSVRIVR